jgi:hypothetical protein
MQGWVQGQGWVVAEALAGQLKAAAAAAAPPAGSQSGAPSASGGTAPPGAAPPPPPVAMVTGLQVVVVRSDGKVLERIFPVKD